jgi:hypothetical protein
MRDRATVKRSYQSYSDAIAGAVVDAGMESLENYLERDKNTPKNRMRIVRIVKSNEPAVINALRTEVSSRSLWRWKRE